MPHPGERKIYRARDVYTPRNLVRYPDVFRVHLFSAELTFSRPDAPCDCEPLKVHQNYYAKNPLSPYCMMNVGTKLVKLRPDISRINRLAREREQTM